MTKVVTKEDEMLVELRKIRESLEKAPAPPPPAQKGFFNEFKDFISKYKIFGLAVAFIIGIYVGGLVQALVKDILLPLLGLLIPGLGSLNTFAPYMGSQQFFIGDFLSALITFLFVMLIVFVVMKVAKKFKIE